MNRGCTRGRALRVVDLLARARGARPEIGKVGGAADENAAIKEALAALKSGDVETAISALEGLLGIAPNFADGAEQEQTEPDEDSPAARRARIGEGISYAMGLVVGGGDPHSYRSRR